MDLGSAIREYEAYSYVYLDFGPNDVTCRCELKKKFLEIFSIYNRETTIIAHAKYVPVWHRRNAPYHSFEHNFHKKVRKVHEADQL